MSNIVLAQATKLATSLGMDIGGDELVQTLKATAFKGQVSDAQMAALLIVANQYGLSPWTKEIYAFPDKNNGIVPVVGVDGWARIINEHTQFDGMDFEQGAESCTCIIYRKDRSRPVKVTEFMDECKRGTGPWQSHPRRMLRHKAMIQCARLAFGYAGIYDQDEAERIVEKDITPTTEIGKQAAAGNVNSERRDELVKAANEVAKRGDVDALRGHFKALSREDRAIIGTDIMQQLKEAAEASSASLVIDGEFQEVGEYDDAAA